MADDADLMPDESPLPGEEDLVSGQLPEEEGEEQPEAEEEERQRQQPERQESPRLRRRKKKPKTEKAEQPKPKKGKPQAPQPKPTPKLKGAEQATEGLAKSGGKAVGKTAQQAGQTAQQAGQAVGKVAEQTARATAKVAQVAAEAAARAALQTAQAAAEAARVAIQTAQAIIQAAIQAAQAAAQAIAAAVSNPYVLLALAVLLIFFILMMQLYTCGANTRSSKAGGSIPQSTAVPREQVDSKGEVVIGGGTGGTEVFDRLRTRIGDGNMVIYAAGSQDPLSVDCGEGSPNCISKLDTRLLLTIDYLSALHDYLEIGLLKTNSPRSSRYTLMNSLAAYNNSNENQERIVESYTAFATGQAMAIIAVDRSKIPEVLGQPILMSWQRTLSEAEVRPVWEELAYRVGVLDRNIPNYRSFVGIGDRETILAAIKNNSANEAAYVAMFQVITRVADLIDRAKGIAKLDSRTVDYLAQSFAIFAGFQDKIGGDPASLSDEEITDVILRLGTPDAIDDLRVGIRLAYKATQVANMVGWNKPVAEGGSLELLKAYEARNKIRQITQELLQMPAKVSLSGNPQIFDRNMVIKQIITYSPEDDLDNGLERLDIFPSGITSVGVGGVGFDDRMRDGVSNYFDAHFSHAPIDNGVFSKMGINFIYNITDLGVATPAEFTFTNDNGGKIYQTTIAGELLKLWNTLVGGAGTIDPETEIAKRATYQDFIQVGF